MVVSIQPVKINTANLNKVGFGNEHENLTHEQLPVSLEPPKDEFVSEKKKSHAVRNGALAGVVIGGIGVGTILHKAKGFAALVEKYETKSKAGLVLAAALAVPTIVFAGIGSIIIPTKKKKQSN